MTFFDRFVDDDVIEFRLIRSASPTIRFWWRKRDIVWSQLKLLNDMGREVYCTVNASTPGQSGKKAIVAVTGLHCDLDSGLPRVWPCPEPTMLIQSSPEHFQAYWLLTSPSQHFDYCENINRRLCAALHGDKAATDCSRILRVPDFINHKRNCQVLLLKNSDARFLLGDFVGLPDVSAATKPTGATPQITKMNALESVSPKLMDRLKAARWRDSLLSRAWRGEIGDGSSDSRWSAASQMAKFGFSREEIAALLLSRRWYNRKSRRYATDEHVRDDVQRIISKLEQQEPTTLLSCFGAKPLLDTPAKCLSWLPADF